MIKKLNTKKNRRISDGFLEQKSEIFILILQLQQGQLAELRLSRQLLVLV